MTDRSPWDKALASKVTRAQAVLVPQNPIPPPSLSTPPGMATSAHYATQVFVSEHPHWHPDTHVKAPPSPIPSHASSSVEATRHDDRPSIQLKFSSSGAKIVNAVVVDPAGRPLYTISGDSKRTKLLFHSTEVATVDWDHSSPRMVFRGKKMKCKKWLRRVGPKTEYVLIFLPHACHSELGRDPNQFSHFRARRFAVEVDAAIVSRLRESMTSSN